jgi:hypothetical protein
MTSSARFARCCLELCKHTSLERSVRIQLPRDPELGNRSIGAGFGSGRPGSG